MSEFISRLATSIQAMLDYREALGYSRKSYAPNLRSLDRFCATNYPDDNTLSREIVLGWLEEQHSGVAGKATAARLLGEYLTAVGKESYILYSKYMSSRTNPTAYVFTDDELAALFKAVDGIQATNEEPFLPEIAPVLFRLIYTCCRI